MRIFLGFVLSLALLALPRVLHSSKASAEQVKAWQDEVAQAEVIKKAEALNGTWQGQCVIAVRQLLGIGRDSGVVGWAKTVATNNTQPIAGAVVKINASQYGHLAVVLKVVDDQMYIYESNYDWTERARTKWVATSDPKIMGYLILNN